MSTQRSKWHSVHVGSETTFGGGCANDETHPLIYLRTREFKQPTGRDVVANSYGAATDAEDAVTPILAPGDVEFKMDLTRALASFPTAAPDSAAAPPWIDTLGYGGLGAIPTAGGYGVLDGISTSTVLQFDIYGDTPATMGFAVGQAVYVRTADAAQILGASMITAVSNTVFTVTVSPPLPSAPATGSTVYGGHDLMLSTLADQPSVEIEHKGEAAYNHQRNYGCSVSKCVISAPAKGLAEIQVGFRSAAPTPLNTGGAATTQTWTWGDGIQTFGGGLYLYDGSTSHKILGGLNIDFGLGQTELPGVHGTDPNGIAGFVRSKFAPRIKIEPSYVSNALRDLFHAPTTTMSLQFWAGTGAASWCVIVPAVRVATPPVPTDREGVLDIPMELQVVAPAPGLPMVLVSVLGGETA